MDRDRKGDIELYEKKKAEKEERKRIQGLLSEMDTNDNDTSEIEVLCRLRDHYKLKKFELSERLGNIDKIIISCEKLILTCREEIRCFSPEKK